MSCLQRDLSKPHRDDTQCPVIFMWRETGRAGRERVVKSVVGVDAPTAIQHNITFVMNKLKINCNIISGILWSYWKTQKWFYNCPNKTEVNTFIDLSLKSRATTNTVGARLSYIMNTTCRHISTKESLYEWNLISSYGSQKSKVNVTVNTSRSFPSFKPLVFTSSLYSLHYSI